MLTFWLVLSEMVVIGGGVTAVLIIGPDREQKRREHTRELEEIDAFLNAIRKVTHNQRNNQ